RHYGPRKLRRSQHGTFDMEMAVDQTGRKVSALKVNDLPGFVFTKADDSPVIDGYVCCINFAAEDIDQTRILDKRLGRLLTARDAEFFLKMTHNSSRPCGSKCGRHGPKINLE